MRILKLHIESASILMLLMLITGTLLAAPPQPGAERTPVRVYEQVLVEVYPPPTYAELFAVPQDKRLVIETISLFPSSSGFIWLEVQKADSTMESLAYLSYDMSGTSPVSTYLESVRLYLEPSEELWLGVSSALASDFTMHVVISGYLLPKDAADLGP